MPEPKSNGIVDLEARIQAKRLEEFSQTLDGFYDEANSISAEYFELMQVDPDTAISRISEYLDRVRNIGGNRAFVEAVAGGPNYDWTGTILEIAALRYGEADHATRRRILEDHLGLYDKLNYIYAQD
ncbi:hypothetical protein HY441_00415, partial [Candidatus Microgenomates bacterium]|nr:hypothetical protein [Candidatus Microgenomates bacterium]